MKSNTLKNNFFGEWYHDKKVLITGGAGFLGSHLVELLVEEGAKVTVLDNFSNGTPKNISNVINKINLLSENILSIEWSSVLQQDFQIIFHLVGNAYVPASVENPGMDFSLNLKVTFDILEELRKTNWPGRFVFPSSAAVYGNPQRIPICENDWTVPISPYGVSKLAAERYTAIYHNLYKLNTASLRLFSIYGPRQRKLVVYDLIKKIINDPKKVLVYGNGGQMRDFIFVKDAGRAMMTVAMKGDFTGEVYNIASGNALTIHELVEQICLGLKVNPNIVFSGDLRPGEPEKWSVNVSRLESLGFVPFYPLQKGLELTIQEVLLTE